ncbi:hypothetical protein [Virgibacillus doumboii]|uniref:hypothetical protein n=1 Tax=Virgibacillus doumboii TaxID=2697503 RepID=UPI0013DE838D|nr:hypothetical protein [Virgibacillus doumboii]
MELWVLVLIIVGGIIGVAVVVDVVARLRGRKIDMSNSEKYKKSRNKHKPMLDQKSYDRDNHFL